MTLRRAVWGHFVVVCAAARFAVAQQPTADSARRETPATLIGHVTDSTGVGLAGAEISVSKFDQFRTVSGDSGEFRMAGLPPGTLVFNVRRLGFEAATFTAVLHPGRTGRTTFALSATAHALPTVAVSDTAIPTHWLDQFEHRRSSSRGTFLTRVDIVRRNARSGTDAIRGVPGIRLAPARMGGGNTVIMTRGAGARTCYPTMYVHGVPYSGVLDDFTADDIEALEVYVGISEIPPELDKNGRGICGAIVVWTRDPRKAP